MHRLLWCVPDLSNAVRILAVNTSLPPGTVQCLFFNDTSVVPLRVSRCTLHC